MLQTKPLITPLAQRKPSHYATPSLESGLSGLSGSGGSLSVSLRNYFEPRFGHDLSGVRVHTDDQADKMTKGVQAQAFTVGRDIVFGKAQYAPGTAEGMRLLAHELTHVMQQGGRVAAVQRSPACANQSQVDEILKKNPRTYPATVTMFIHEIASGDTLTSLAKGIEKDNKVVNIPDLVTELQALNSKVKGGRIGNCVVLIKGWTSQSWVKQDRRFNCDERIENFKKDKALAKFKKWERDTVGKKDRTYHDLVDRTATRTPTLFTGRREEYVKFVETLNDPWVGLLNVGECVAMPVGWVDPNIGQLPAKPGLGSVSGDVAHAIATIYAEQTRLSSNAQEQQKYIWFSMRKRVETPLRGPDLKSVVVASEYHAIDQNKNDYEAAIKDLKNKSPLLSGVANAKKAVLDNWATSLPGDAGAFYFHWLDVANGKKTMVETCFDSSKGKTDDEKEKECAWQWAKKQGFEGNIAQSQGWLKRIRGDSSTPKVRIGSMYIYP